MRDELTGFRDQSYSHWHRVALPDHYGQIDVDWLEYCKSCYQPLALMETAKGLDQEDKVGSAMASLARAAGVPAYLVLYEIRPCACSRAKCPGTTVSTVKVKCLTSPDDWRELTPSAWAAHIQKIRQRHDGGCTGWRQAG